jgi:hypothetical protein
VNCIERQERTFGLCDVRILSTKISFLTQQTTKIAEGEKGANLNNKQTNCAKVPRPLLTPHEL